MTKQLRERVDFSVSEGISEDVILELMDKGRSQMCKEHILNICL